MKKVLYITIVLVLVAAMIFGGIYLNQRAIDTAYNYAITLIQNGSYEGALLELEKANPDVIEREEFMSDVKYGGLDEAYKNTIPLYSYAMAQLEYNDEDRYMQTVNEYLELIPADYNGELCEEINTFKGNFKPQYNEFLEEEKRKAEELRLQMEESNRQFYAKLKTKLPYEGMSEDYIDSTMMGRHDKLIADDDNDDFVYNVYYWNANNGDTMLAVSCINGKVDHVSKYYEWAYWTSDGKPKPNGTNYRSSSTKKSNKDSDLYNVNDHSDPEDFYDDNYDDFWDYEEAEDYYNSYHEDP